MELTAFGNAKAAEKADRTRLKTTAGSDCTFPHHILQHEHIHCFSAQVAL